MNIDQVLSSVTPKPGTTPQATTATSARDEFLRLFVAQLEQQNPLDPQTGAEFVAQLAQFATVEQSVETNNLLADIRADQIASAGLELAGLVGKSAVADTDNFHVRGEGVIPPVSLELEGSATSASVEILDENGRLVRTVDVGPSPAGTYEVALPDDLEPGNYALRLRATGANGEDVAGRTRFRAAVSAVDYTGNTPRLQLGGIDLSPADIESIE